MNEEWKVKNKEHASKYMHIYHMYMKSDEYVLDKKELNLLKKSISYLDDQEKDRLFHLQSKMNIIAMCMTYEPVTIDDLLDVLNKNFVIFYKEYKSKNRMSDEYCCRKIGITRMSLHRFLNKKDTPSIQLIHKCSIAFKIDVVRFFM